MDGMTSQEISKVVYRYIGVSGGYLGDFSYPTHAQFYPLYCNLDIDPYQYEGTTRERFIKILQSQTPYDQAKILRGVIERFPVDGSVTRTEALQDELRRIIARLEQNTPVLSPSPAVTSRVVDQAIADAEHLIKSSGAASAVDRVHTAMHGYLKAVCDREQISYAKDDSITRLLKILRQNHPALHATNSGNQDVERILNSFGSILDTLNTLRNQASLAHPNSMLLKEEEAMLAINASRTILHYLNAKFQ